MSFRDDVAADVMDTFLASDEFAEMHIVNGKEMLASIDKYSLDTEDKARIDSHKDGIHKKRMVLQVAADEFGALPAAGSLVSVDGRKYFVLSSDSVCGMYVITLEVSRG